MGHGGKRSGAGRKETSLSRTSRNLKRATAEEILSDIDEKAFWSSLLNATYYADKITLPDNKIRLEAGKYLTDRRDGKPKQALVGSNDESDSPIKVLLIGAKSA